MKTFDYTITIPLGIHARPATSLYQFTKSLSSDTYLCCDGKEVNAKNLVAILTLRVQNGMCVTLKIQGPQEEKDMIQLKHFFENNL